MAQGLHHKATLHPTLALARHVEGHRHLTLIALGNTLSLAVVDLSIHRTELDVTPQGRLNRRLQLPLAQLYLRQGTQVISSLSRYPRACLARGHLAVAYVQ